MGEVIPESRFEMTSRSSGPLARPLLQILVLRQEDPDVTDKDFRANLDRHPPDVIGKPNGCGLEVSPAWAGTRG